MVVATSTYIILSFCALTIRRVAPCAICKLVHIPLIALLGFGLRYGEIMVICKPGLTSFDSSLLNSRLIDKTLLIQITNRVYSGFSKDPILVLFFRNVSILRGMRSRGPHKKLGILGLKNSKPLVQLGVLLTQLSNSLLEPSFLSFSR